MLEEVKEVQTAMDSDGNIVDADEVECEFYETRFSGWDMRLEHTPLGSLVSATVMAEVKDIGEKTGKDGERVYYQKLKVKEILSLAVVQPANTGEED